MNAQVENNAPTLENVGTKLDKLESSAPSIEVFTQLMRLNHELVDAYMALPEAADKEPANVLDVRIKAFSNQLLTVLQQKEERHAAQVVALSTRTNQRPTRRVPSMRQVRDMKRGDVMQAAA